MSDNRELDVEQTELTDAECAAMVALAGKLGTEAGKRAASWVFDGNTSHATYARVLQGIEDGDPEVMDSLRVPNLSGEFAGDPTPRSLAEDCGLDEESDGGAELLDELCTAWEDAAGDAFWVEVERVARYQVERTD